MAERRVRGSAHRDATGLADAAALAHPAGLARSEATSRIGAVPWDGAAAGSWTGVAALSVAVRRPGRAARDAWRRGLAR